MFETTNQTWFVGDYGQATRVSTHLLSHPKHQLDQTYGSPGSQPKIKCSKESNASEVSPLACTRTQ